MARQTKPNAEEAIKLVKDAESIETLDKLQEGEARKTVLDAIEKKRTELTSADDTKDGGASGPEKDDTKSASAQAPEIMVNKAVGTVLVANQHTGGVTFPRKGPGGMVAKPLRLAPGEVTEVDADEWAKYKKMPLVQHYLDAGLLAEAQKKGAVPVLSQSTSDLPIPEHLQTEEESKGDTAKAGVRREKAGTVTID